MSILHNRPMGFVRLKYSDMQKENEKAGKLSMQVTEGLAVQVYPSHEHQFLLPTKEVALGYGISPYTLRRHKQRNPTELIAGKHFIEGVQILNGAKGNASKGTMWTKRGIVRLGFFIKSERAKLFRDWAEDLIIKVEEHKNLFGDLVATPQKAIGKRNHNRLTQTRLVAILADVAKIEDKQIRLSIIQKLGL